MASSTYRWKDDDNASQRKAIAATVAVQLLLLFALLFNGFVTPLPLPGEQGIAVSFGAENAGRGGVTRYTSTTTASTPTPPPPSTPQLQHENAHLAQDFEEAPAIERKAQPTLQPKQPPKSSTRTPESPTSPKKEPPRQVDQSALFPGSPQPKQGGGVGDGGTAGNQGSPNAPLYTGKPGGRGGDGQSGSGKGNGAGGNGISYSLNGRTALQLPPPEYPKQRGGRVVVKVWVDRNGKVLQAEPGEPGSTTFDQALLQAAKKAALQAQFDIAANAPNLQTGSITYVFQLKQ